MRIRRRPQPALQPGSDPTTSTTAPQTLQWNAARSRGWLGAAGTGGGGGEDREAKLPRAGADLGHKSGVARRLALPQDDGNVAEDRGRSVGGARQHGVGAGAGDGGHKRFGAVSNGHRSTDQKDGVACVGGKAEPVAVAEVEERVARSNGGLQLALVPVPAATAKVEERAASNGGLQLALVPVPAATAKVEERAASNGGLQLALVPVPAAAVSGRSGGGAKKRRGPAVLLEGSRCSRVNGRGWRCSQPTLVGYSLCEHHLGKGRMRSAAAAAARGRLGRTEHGAARTTAPAAVVGAASTVTIAAAPPPRADAPPSLPALPPC